VAKILIGVPTYNRRHELKKTLESIKNQTFSDYRVVISDNCSTDGTREYLESFCATNNDFRYVVQPKNIGWKENFNYLLSHACDYEYFAWLASDDIWSESYLEDCVYVLDRNKNIGVVQATVRIIKMLDNDHSRLIRKDVFRLVNYLPRMLQLPLIFSRGYNVYIMGVFRSNLLTRAFRHFPNVPSADRYFLLQILCLGYSLATVKTSSYVRLKHSKLAPDRYPDDLYLQNVAISSKKIFDFESFSAIRSMLISCGCSPLFKSIALSLFYFSRFYIGFRKLIKLAISTK